METLPYFLGAFGVITTLYSAVNVFFAKKYRQYVTVEGPLWMLIGVCVAIAGFSLVRL